MDGADTMTTGVGFTSSTFEHHGRLLAELGWAADLFRYVELEVDAVFSEVSERGDPELGAKVF